MATEVADQSVVSAASTEMQRNLGIMTPEQKDVYEKANKADHIFKYCMTGRRPAELNWFINDTYHNDQEQLRYNTANNRLEPVPAQKATARININKSKQLTRGITSYINREHPIVNVWPGPNQTTSDSFDNARLEQQLIYHWYDHLQINNINKKVTTQGVKYGVGWWKVLWDSDATAPTSPYMVNGEASDTVAGEVWVGHSNTYDVYPDFRATYKGDMRFINEAFPRTIAELHANKKYDENVVDRVAADDKAALSTMKYSSMNSTYRTSEMAHQTDPMQRTILLRETYVKEYDLEEQRWLVRLYVTTESNLLLYCDEWPMNEFPYEFYQSDIADEIFQSEGAIKDIRGLQSALSRGASQVEETMQIMGKINWLIPRGSGINIITDETGQFVQYNPSAGVPHQSAPVNLPQYTDKHMMNLEKWIDDIGGVHDATNGKSPHSRASGDLVDALQRGDSNSLAMYKDNFEDGQVRLYKLMLKTAKHHYVTTRRIPLNARDAVGNYQYIELSGKDISLEDKVQVRTGGVLPFDQGERVEMAISLKKEGIIDAQAALRMTNLMDVEAVMGNDQQDVERQLIENKILLAGKDIDDPVIAEGHGAHIKVIDELVKSKEWFEKYTDPQKKAILDHRSKHIKYSIDLKKIEASMNVGEIRRVENMTVREASTSDMSPAVAQQWWDKFGINADSAEIQVRGGTFIQDEMEAQTQADLENKLFAEGEFPRVSPQDNHRVHHELHQALINSDEFQMFSKTEQARVNEHDSQHIQMEQALQHREGLLATSESQTAIPSHALMSAGMKAANRKKQEEVAAQQQAQAKAQEAKAAADMSAAH